MPQSNEAGRAEYRGEVPPQAASNQNGFAKSELAAKAAALSAEGIVGGASHRRPER